MTMSAQCRGTRQRVDQGVFGGLRLGTSLSAKMVYHFPQQLHSFQ